MKWICVIPWLLVTTASAERLIFLGNEKLEPLLYSERGVARGLVAELTQAALDAADIPADIRLMNWAQAQTDVREGRADALMQINPNPERRQWLAFSDPLLVTEFSVFTRSGFGSVNELQDLASVQVGVEPDSYPLQLLSDQDIQAQTFDSWSDAFFALENGEIEAVLVDKWVGLHELALNNIDNVVVHPDPIETSTSRIAVRKQDQALLNQINRGLDTIAWNGTKAAILKRWDGSEVVYLLRDEIQTFVYWALAAVAGLTLLAGLWSLRQSWRKQAITAAHLDQVQRINSELEMANRELRSFHYLSSHHYQEPVRQVAINLHWLADELPESLSDEARRHMELAIEASGKIRAMTDDLLEYNSLTRPPELEPVDLNEALEATLSELADYLNEHDAHVEYQGLPKVLAARSLLSRLLKELIINAAQFRHEGRMPTIEISAQEQEDCVALRVRDNSVGMDPIAANKAFALFSRLDPTRSQGTGTGLAVASKIAKLMNANLHLLSTSNQGSEFELILPKGRTA